MYSIQNCKGKNAMDAEGEDYYNVLLLECCKNVIKLKIKNDIQWDVEKKHSHHGP